MSYRCQIWIGLFVGLALVLGGSATRAEAQSECKITISSPLPGDKVGKQGRVRGTAELLPGAHLWVVAHMKDLTAEWWPQGGRPAVIGDDGSWVIVVGYGTPDDTGEDFEVAAVAVTADTDRKLREWFKKANEKGEYPPIEFPDTFEGCVPVKVTVKKTSH